MESMDIAVTQAIQRMYKAALELRQSPNLATFGFLATQVI
jgi:hypothetical protein